MYVYEFCFIESLYALKSAISSHAVNVVAPE